MTDSPHTPETPADPVDRKDRLDTLNARRIAALQWSEQGHAREAGAFTRFQGTRTLIASALICIWIAASIIATFILSSDLSYTAAWLLLDLVSALVLTVAMRAANALLDAVDTLGDLYLEVRIWRAQIGKDTSGLRKLSEDQERSPFAE